MLKEVLVTEVEVDFKFGTIRNYEAGLATWIANLINCDMMCDACFLNSGSFRSDRVYPPGYVFTLDDIYEIFPIETHFCQLEMTGQQVLECLENSVSKWPALEGRYLQLGGVTFKYDPKKEGGQRVIDGSVIIAGDELDLFKKYNICTTGYMALGKDGYDTICDAKIIIDEENGPELMNIIKEYLEFIQHTEIREDYDSFKKFDRETSLEILEDCYNRKAQKKNMYIASIQEAVNQSFVVGLLGRAKTIKSDKNIQQSIALAEGEEVDGDLLVNKRTLKDMEAIKKDTDSPLNVIEL